MKAHALAAVSLILILSLVCSAQAQNRSTEKQLSFLVGYTPVHVGSKINHDKRLAASFRLSGAKLSWDFDLEYYTSNDSWARPFHDGGDLLLSNNTQETSGFGFSIGIAKPTFENTTISFGLSGNYFDISQELDKSVHVFDSGAEIADYGLPQKERDARFLAPGIFVQTDLSFTLNNNSELYLKQKFNWIYLGNRFQSSFWDSWIAYTVYGGLRLSI